MGSDLTSLIDFLDAQVKALQDGPTKSRERSILITDMEKCAAWAREVERREDAAASF